MKKTLLSALFCGMASMALAQGTVEAPLSVDEFLALGEATEATDAVVKGYIVGVVEGGSWTEQASFTAPFSTSSNLILAGSSTETDIAYCLPVQLPSGSVRTALSPAGHPENLGHEVILTGKRAKYFTVPGLKETSAYQWVGDAPVPPAVPVEQRGTKEAPLSVADYLKYGADGATVEDCWLSGVIVGYVDGQNIEEGAVFGATGDNVSVSNILVAAAADVKDLAACIPVQLPKGDVRSALNLKDNPANLGKPVVLHGVREKYFGVTGLKSVDECILDGKTPEPPVEKKYIYKGLEIPGGNADGWTFEQGELPEGLDYVWSWTDSYGIKASSFKKLTDIPEDTGANKADAWAVSPVIDLTGCSDIKLEFQQCTNFFKETQKEQALVFIREEGAEWTPVELTPAMTEDSWNFVDCTYDLAGYADKKIQFGFNYKCNGEVAGTWEIKNFFITGEGGNTDNPDPKPEVKSIYSGLTVPGGNAEDWTLEQGTLPEGLEYVWAWDDTYGIKASAYKDNACHEADAWAISPVIDLSGDYTDLTLSFQQAGNKFFGHFAEQVSVNIRKAEEGSEWTVCTIADGPDGSSWNYVDNSLALDDFKGEKIQFGFHYTSTAEVAGTWEIRNFVVSGKDRSGVRQVIGGECVRVIGSDIVAPEGARVFNLNGVETGATGLTGGVYIVVCDGKAHKVMVK